MDAKVFSETHRIVTGRKLPCLGEVGGVIKRERIPCPSSGNEEKVSHYVTTKFMLNFLFPVLLFYFTSVKLAFRNDFYT